LPLFKQVSYNFRISIMLKNGDQLMRLNLLVYLTIFDTEDCDNKDFYCKSVIEKTGDAFKF